MRRVAGLVALLLTLPAAAAELGRAEGTLTIDKNTINLGYAYAVGRQRNEITSRRDDVKIILTDKALAPDAKLEDIDFNFPEGVFGIVLHVSNQQKVTHVVVQHSGGTYDAGFSDGLIDFRYKPDAKVRGVVAGRVSSPSIKTNTMTFSVDSAFNAIQH